MLGAFLLLLAFAPTALAQETLPKAPAPTRIVAEEPPLELAPGTASVIELTFLPENADTRVKFATSKKTVATVNSKGVVTAKQPGKATITVTAKKGSKKLKIPVTVAYPDDGAKYHFYGIGNGAYPARVGAALPSCVKDVERMSKAFARATFRGTPYRIQTSTNLTAVGILALLAKMATDTDITEKDTTVFYYSGHGGDTRIPGNPNNGALIGVDGNWVPVDDVRKMLDQVPGRVIVILDSCLSGQFIQSKGVTADTYNQGILNAFAGSSNKALTDSSDASKYKILTAAQPMESAWAIETKTKQYGIFTSFVTAAINGNRPADTGKDKRVSMNELYKYTNKNVKALLKKLNKSRSQANKISQSVMFWPMGDKSFVFAMD